MQIVHLLKRNIRNVAAMLLWQFHTIVTHRCRTNENFSESPPNPWIRFYGADNLLNLYSSTEHSYFGVVFLASPAKRVRGKCHNVYSALTLAPPPNELNFIRTQSIEEISNAVRFVYSFAKYISGEKKNASNKRFLAPSKTISAHNKSEMAVAD